MNDEADRQKLIEAGLIDPDEPSLEVGAVGSVGGGTATSGPPTASAKVLDSANKTAEKADPTKPDPDNPNYDPTLEVHEGWDIVRDPTLEAVSTYDREHFGQTPELSGTGLSTEDFDQYGDHGSTSTGMTYDEFEAEWLASGADRNPTQEDYENWIQWGDPGKLAADLSGDTTTIKLEDGQKVTVYTEESLQYAMQNNIELDWAEDNSLVVFPNSDDVKGLLPERYTAVETETGMEDLFTMYYKEEKADWYEDPWVAAAIGLALGVVGGAVVGAGLSAAGVGSGVAAGATAGEAVGSIMMAYGGAGALPAAATMSAAVSSAVVAGSGIIGGVAGATAAGVLSGAASGAISSGVAAELMGGDFWEAAKDGAISGGVAGGVGTYGQLTNMKPAEIAVLRGMGASTTDLLLGKDWDEAVESGLIAGAASSVGSEVAQKHGGRLGAIAETATRSLGQVAFQDRTPEEALMQTTLGSGQIFASPEIRTAVQELTP